MRKLILLILLLPLFANAQYLNVGNTLQRQIAGMDSLYRFNMGSTGYLPFYSKSGVDAKFALRANTVTVNGSTQALSSNPSFTIPSLDTATAFANLVHKTGAETILGVKSFGSSIRILNGSYYGSLYPTTLTSNRAYALPNASGTIALTSDLSSYVPYTGATANVSLGVRTLDFSSGSLSSSLTSTGLSMEDNFNRTSYNTGQSLKFSSSASPTNYTLYSKEGVGRTIGGFTNDIGFIDPTGNRNIYFPDASGTVALTSNLSSYLQLTGGTLSGSLTGTTFVKTGGTSSQFLKADGSVDANSYLTTSSASSTYLPLIGGTITGNTVLNGGGYGSIGLYTAYSGSPSNPGILVTNYAGTVTFEHNSNGGATFIGGALTGTSASFNAGTGIGLTVRGGDGGAGTAIFNVNDVSNVNKLTILGNGNIVAQGTITAPTFSGTLTGNASTATALATARTIQGVSFDGTANINPINGTGFVKASGTTLSYDNSTYLTTSSASSTYAPLASPTFTGTVTSPTYAVDNAVVNTSGMTNIFGSNGNGLLEKFSFSAARTGLSINNVDNTSDASKPVSTATQTALDLKVDVANIIAGSATIDFGAISGNSESGSGFTVTGAAIGDVVSVGVPYSSSDMPAGVVFTGYVSATNQVTIRAINSFITTSSNPPSGVFKVKVFK